MRVHKLNILKYPITHGISIDDPQTTLLRKNIIQNKSYLRKIYQEWYEAIVTELPPGVGPILELGSGAGFLNEYLPDVITSEVFFTPLVSIIIDGCSLPFKNQSLHSIVMVDVFHHIPDPRNFLSEATRCIHIGGRVIMIEPWLTPWSQFIYKYFHHEPCFPDVIDWGFPSSGPLSGANSALPWIVFERDKKTYKKDFPQLHIAEIRVWMPFRYLLSGGLAFRSFMPGFSFEFWKKFEACLGKWNEKLGMFARIVLTKR
jgi:SAM-dependent methyltransferase